MGSGRLISRVGPNLRPAALRNTTRRCMCGKALSKKEENPSDSQTKVWGGANLDLPQVTSEQAQESFKDVTSVSRAITPPTGLADQARKDMVKERFEYVQANLRPGAQYVVPGASGAAVAPVAVSQSSLAVATALVVMGGITAAMYIKTQWNVSSPMELGDRLREKGAMRRQSIEKSGAVSLVRTVSQTADTTVKANVDLVRKPSQRLGSNFHETFQHVGKKGKLNTDKRQEG